MTAAGERTGNGAEAEAEEEEEAASAVAFSTRKGCVSVCVSGCVCVCVSGECALEARARACTGEDKALGSGVTGGTDGATVRLAAACTATEEEGAEVGGGRLRCPVFTTAEKVVVVVEEEEEAEKEEEEEAGTEEGAKFVCGPRTCKDEA